MRIGNGERQAAIGETRMRRVHHCRSTGAGRHLQLMSVDGGKASGFTVHSVYGPLAGAQFPRAPLLQALSGLSGKSARR